MQNRAIGTPLIIQPIGLGFPAWVFIVSVTILFSRNAEGS